MALKEELGNMVNPTSLDVTLAVELVSHNAQFLEMVSTYAFLIGSGYSTEQANQKMIELKPHLGHFSDEATQFYHTRVALSQ